MSSFWNWFIIILTVANIVAAMWLLLWTAKRPAHEDAESDTGHVWDGDLREMNRPLPRWWLGLFVLTVIFAVAYLILYPGLGNFKGVLGWTEIKQYQAQVEKADQQFADFYAQFQGDEIPTLARSAAALSAGRNLFVNNCAACHGSDARGAPGFPNLADKDWLYGGTPEAIQTSITLGRGGIMPPLGASMQDDQLDAVVAYVRSLSGSEAPAEKIIMGRQLFQTTCVGCHGMDARGNKFVGAPDLTDSIWLYGGSKAAVKQTLLQGRQGHMPPHKDKLGEHKIKLLAAYVWSLSNVSEDEIHDRDHDDVDHDDEDHHEVDED